MGLKAGRGAELMQARSVGGSGGVSIGNIRPEEGFMDIWEPIGSS